MHGLGLLQRVDERLQRGVGHVFAQAQQRVDGSLDEGVGDLVRIVRVARAGIGDLPVHRKKAVRV